MSGFKRESFHVLFNLDEYRFSFRGLKILFIAFVVLHFLTAFLATAVYKMIVTWNALSPSSLNENLIRTPFPEYYNRVLWLLLLLSIPWFLIQCRLLSLRKLGLQGDFPWYSSFVRFYMVGLIGAVGMLVILISVGVVQVENSLSLGALLGGLILAFLSAFVIGLTEELVFRSLFFRLFYTALTPLVSIFLSSLFFAYLHFKEPIGLWYYEMPPADVSWLDGLAVSFWVVTGILVNFNLVLFINLTLVGYILTVVFVKTRSLWAAVGLHAGWVTPIVLFAKIALENPDNSSTWWGTFRLADGYFATVCLLFIAFYFSRFYQQRQKTGFTY